MAIKFQSSILSAYDFHQQTTLWLPTTTTSSVPWLPIKLNCRPPGQFEEPFKRTWMSQPSSGSVLRRPISALPLPRLSGGVPLPMQCNGRVNVGKIRTYHHLWSSIGGANGKKCTYVKRIAKKLFCIRNANLEIMKVFFLF